MDFQLESGAERGQCTSCGHDLVYPFFFTAGLSDKRPKASKLIRFFALFNLKFSRKIQRFFHQCREKKQQVNLCKGRLRKSDLQALQYIEIAIKMETHDEH